MQHRSALVALAAAGLLAGCGGSSMPGGGTPDITTVRSCLAKAGLKAEDFAKEDKKVSRGVFATSGLGGARGAGDSGGGAANEFTFAVAAVVRDEKTVTQFQKDTREFSETLSVGEQKLVIDSGTSGRYVWVVGGVKGAAAYDTARECVQD